MKRILLFASFLALMASCINEQETINVAHNRELDTIKKYMQETPLPSVRTEQDGETGIVMIWTKEEEDGQRPKLLEKVSINYTGSFLDGRIFDTSIDSVARANNIHNPNRDYGPWGFTVGNREVILGFDFAIYNMKVGDKTIVIIPSRYAYGSSPRQGIPANSILRFDLELLEIKTEQVGS